MTKTAVHALARILRIGLLMSAVFLAGCVMQPEVRQPDAAWVPSPNFDERRPNFIIIHGTTSERVEHALRTLTDPERKVSAHYLIGRDGHVIQLVDERQRAWHAGASRWGMLSDLNSASIGIELDNTGYEVFPDVQINALVALLGDVVERHLIPPANILGHGDIAPRRKVDPSRHFPWQRLARAGFGLWCDNPPPAPAGFDAHLGLRAFGYDTSDLPAAKQAFRRHFAGEDGAEELTPADQAMLYCLLGLPR